MRSAALRLLARLALFSRAGPVACLSAVRASALGRRESSTFVSDYFSVGGRARPSAQIDPSEIEQFLQGKGMQLRQTSSEFMSRECPFCPKPHNNQPDNLFKLYISKTSGTYYCHRCGAKGSWYDLKHTFGDLKITRESGYSQQTGSVPEVAFDEVRMYSQNLLNNTDFQPVLQYMTETRGIQSDILRRFGVGACLAHFEAAEEPEFCVTFPFIELVNSRPVVKRLKMRSITSKAHQRSTPVGSEASFFGWHTIAPDCQSLIITEGEIDALSVFQSTGFPAASLPNGCHSLSPLLIRKLESIPNIFLWMDNDRQDAAQNFSQKLGYKRCKSILPSLEKVEKPFKDANEALKLGYDLKEFVLAAKPVSHDSIVSFNDLSESIYYDIVHSKSFEGVPCRSFPVIRRTIGGLRRGELTILTGPTGAGKTTLLSQLSLDYASQGVNTLWGSFEIPNKRLVKVMMQQYFKQSLPESKSDYVALANEFAGLPFHFLKFYGSTDLERVLNAMDYCIYVYDTEHVIIDNLQFMFSEVGNGYEKFDLLDRAISRFRNFATQKNVHITLVIHPRKEATDTALSLASVFGTAKATQESDNVIILQYVDGKKRIEVKKNRYNGELGGANIEFNYGFHGFVEIEDKKSKKKEAKKEEASAMPPVSAPSGSATGPPSPAPTPDSGVIHMNPAHEVLVC